MSDIAIQPILDGVLENSSLELELDLAPFHQTHCTIHYCMEVHPLVALPIKTRFHQLIHHRVALMENSSNAWLILAKSLLWHQCPEENYLVEPPHQSLSCTLSVLAQQGAQGAQVLS